MVNLHKQTFDTIDFVFYLIQWRKWIRILCEEMKCICMINRHTTTIQHLKFRRGLRKVNNFQIFYVLLWDPLYAAYETNSEKISISELQSKNIKITLYVDDTIMIIYPEKSIMETFSLIEKSELATDSK